MRGEEVFTTITRDKEKQRTAFIWIMTSASKERMFISAKTTLVLCFILFLTCNPTSGLNNGLARTPPMGWMSWVRFACEINCTLYPKDCINQDLYMEMADMLADQGYKEAGYQYINIDDCWSEMKRDPKTNKLVPNQQRFPDGIPALAQYIHSKGLKFGKIFEKFFTSLTFARHVEKMRKKKKICCGGCREIREVHKKRIVSLRVFLTDKRLAQKKRILCQRSSGKKRRRRKKKIIKRSQIQEICVGCHADVGEEGTK